MRPALLRLQALTAVAVSLAALAVLWRFRPERPEAPDSLSSPVTTAFLQELALAAAWLLAALVAFMLLARGLAGMRARPRFDLRSDATHLNAREAGRLRRPRGVFPPLAAPILLVVAPREATPAPRAEEAVKRSGTSAALPDAEPDERPFVSLLGPLAIVGGKRSRRGLRARALEVIAFLVLRREGAQRDEILEALWPGEDPRRSRHRLYQAVRDARRLLGEAVASERDRYWLDRGRVRTDADALEDLLERARRADTPVRRQLLEKALALFRGEPLAGSDFAWAEGEIRRLRGTFIQLLQEVGGARLEIGDGRGALDAAERGIAADLLNEDLWRLALEAEGRLGLREAIESRYERLRTLLDERLGLEPAKETRALYRELLAQR